MERERDPNSIPGTGQKMKFFVFDSETSGLYPNKDRIIELAVAELVVHNAATQRDNGMEPFSVLIDPERKLTAFNMSIHGIKNEMLVNKPRFPEAWDLFSSYIASRCEENDRPVLVAHNVDFDVKFLRSELQRSGKPFPNWDVACSMKVFQNLFPGQCAKLKDLRAKFSVSNYTEHRAAGDVKVLGDVLNGIHGIAVEKGQTVLDLILDDVEIFQTYDRQNRERRKVASAASSSRTAWPICEWCDYTSTPETSPDKKLP